MHSSANTCLVDVDAAPGVAIAPGPPDAAPSPALRRVLYVVSQFPSWSETFIVREIRALVDDGVDVRILSLKRGSATMVQAEAAALMDRVWPQASPPLMVWRALLAASGHPRRVGAAVADVVAGTWRTPLVMLKSLATLAASLARMDELRRFDPEFIHAHWSTYPATAAWLLSRVATRPFGFTCHAHDVFRNQHMLARKIGEAALAVTISRHNVEWLGLNVTELATRRLEVVHCGVDLRQIAWHPDDRQADTILAVGRLAPEKGFHTLIQALARLQAEGVACRCTIIGEGPARGELQASIDAHGLGARVRLAGAQPQEAVRAALETATVFALPCQVAANGSRDGIPVALMEAMAAGCPVVSCAVSGVPELIGDGEHGLLAREADPASLADVLKRLLCEPALRTSLALAARRRIELEFDARREAAKLLRLMSKAVADAT